MSKYNFIITDDKNTVEELRKLGFQEVQTVDNKYVFLNNNKMFFEIKSEHIVYSNKLLV